MLTAQRAKTRELKLCYCMYVEIYGDSYVVRTRVNNIILHIKHE